MKYLKKYKLFENTEETLGYLIVDIKGEYGFAYEPDFLRLINGKVAKIIKKYKETYFLFEYPYFIPKYLNPYFKGANKNRLSIEYYNGRIVLNTGKYKISSIEFVYADTKEEVLYKYNMLKDMKKFNL